MKLSQYLMTFAEENGIHEPGDEPCHCDICQYFVPRAIEQEQELLTMIERVGRWFKVNGIRYVIVNDIYSLLNKYEIDIF